jgi:hypothetical protein
MFKALAALDFWQVALLAVACFVCMAVLVGFGLYVLIHRGNSGDGITMVLPQVWIPGCLLVVLPPPLIVILWFWQR